MDAACFQPHQCLGDARQFQQLKEQQTQLELERLRQQQQHGQQQVDPTPAGMASIDPSTVNPDVWAAASLLGDKGVQLIQIYRELEECRWVVGGSRPSSWMVRGRREMLLLLWVWLWCCLAWTQ